jgi:hypothetical protein
MAETRNRMTGKAGEALSFLRARPFPAVLTFWVGRAVARAALFPSGFSSENVHIDRNQVLIFMILAHSSGEQSNNDGDLDGG